MGEKKRERENQMRLEWERRRDKRRWNGGVAAVCRDIRWRVPVMIRLCVVEREERMIYIS